MILSSSLISKAIRLSLSAAIITMISAFFHQLIPSNNETIALTFLLAILGISTVWGLAEAILASILAVLEFNYFFLPPLGWTIGGPRNWMALGTFLITAIAASQLSAAAKRRTAEALRYSRDVERLHQLSQAILHKSGVRETAAEIVKQLVRIFEARDAALFIKSENETFRAGFDSSALSDQQLRDAADSPQAVSSGEGQVMIAPLSSDARPIGSLGMTGSVLSVTTQNAIAHLAAIGIERAFSLEKSSRLEAIRQSEELKSALLDALAHDLKTPLAAIKGALTHLLGKQEDTEKQELLLLANEETDLLILLAADIIEMARINSGELHPQRRTHPIGDIIFASLEDLEVSLKGRPLNLQLPESLPAAIVDLDLIKRATKQLLDNAIKYSPPESPITIGAKVERDNIVISVTDWGDGIDERDQARIFEKFFRGRQSRYNVKGTGLGLSIAKGMIEANGGSIWVSSQPGKGSTFSFSLPADRGDSSNELG